MLEDGEGRRQGKVVESQILLPFSMLLLPTGRKVNTANNLFGEKLHQR